MKKLLSVITIFIILSGCMASTVSQYGTTKKTDKFSNNQITVVMKGGLIDADYLGVASNAAEFNPFVVRSKDNKITYTGIFFTFKNNVTLSRAKWLNISEGSTAIFLLDNGTKKVTLTAAKGNIDYSVDALQNTVYTTHYDKGIFSATPQQLEQIANSSSVEIRISGVSSSIDFPRKPNYRIVENFLPNIKKFYETEIAAFL